MRFRATIENLDSSVYVLNMKFNAISIFHYVKKNTVLSIHIKNRTPAIILRQTAQLSRRTALRALCITLFALCSA